MIQKKKTLRKFIFLYFIVLLLFICLDCLLFTHDKSNASPSSGKPVILYLDVESGPPGVFVTLNGHGFTRSDTVRFGNTIAIPLSASNQYQIWPAYPAPVSSRVTVMVPDLSNDIYKITVQNAKGISNAISFTVRKGNVYYVSVSGADGNTGTLSSPWRTLNYAVRHVSDGDFIYVREGIYTETDPDEPTRLIYWRTSYSQGKTGRPITLQAYPGENVLLSAKGSSEPREIISVISPYINLIGLKMGENRRASIHVYDQGDRVRIINCEVFHAARDPLGSGGIDSDINSEGVQILGSYIHDVGTVDSGSNKNHGMYIQGQNMIIAYNVIGDTGNDGFRSDVGIQSYPRNAVQTGVIVKNNLIFDVRRGILLDNAPGPGFLIQNNIIRNCDWSGIWIRNGSTAQIYNNTLVNNGWKGSSRDRSQIFLSYNGLTIIKNNILYSSYYSGMISGASSSDVDYNLYFYTGGPITNGGGSHSIAANPKFLSIADNDFHLQSTSPAINAGTLAVSAVVVTDYEGISRPQGSGYDIGAYEYNE